MLVEVYEGILRFHKRAMGFFRRSGLSAPPLILCSVAARVTVGSEFLGVSQEQAILGIGNVLKYSWSLKLTFFCVQAWKKLFSASWDGFREPFSEILSALKKHQALLEKEEHLSNFENVNSMTESLNVMIKDLVEKDEQNRRQQVDAYRWLSAADYSSDHNHFLSTRSGFPRTSMWLFQRRDMISWQDSSSDVSIFWLHGMLGSGIHQSLNIL